MKSQEMSLKEVKACLLDKCNLNPRDINYLTPQQLRELYDRLHQEKGGGK